MWPQVHGECRPAGRELWEAPLLPAPPTPSSSGPLLRVAQPSAPPPAAPHRLGSPSVGPHTAGWTVWLPFRGESSCPGSCRMGLGGVCSPAGSWLQRQQSPKSSGFDSGLACVRRLQAGVLGPLWLSALGWPHTGLGACHNPRVSPVWGRVALGPALSQSTGWDLLASPGPFSSQDTPSLFCVVHATLCLRSDPPGLRPGPRGTSSPLAHCSLCWALRA